MCVGLCVVCRSVWCVCSRGVGVACVGLCVVCVVGGVGVACVGLCVVCVVGGWGWRV